MFKTLFAATAFLSFFAVAQASDLTKEMNVTVEVMDATGHGSGVILPNHLILTAKHVIDHVKNPTIKYSDGTLASGKVVWMSKTTDLALVQTSVPGSLEPATVSCRKLDVGEPVTIVGYPVVLPISIEHGYVMSAAIQVKGINVVPLDALLLPGNSGGPVFDANDNVIGIADMTIEGHDLGFMVPIPQEICDAKLP